MICQVAPFWRSTLKPVSLLEVSAQLSAIDALVAGWAARKVGALGAPPTTGDWVVALEGPAAVADCPTAFTANTW